MTQTVFDRRGRRYTFSIVEAHPLLLIQIHQRQILVGEVKCLGHPAGVLEIKDIAIANEVSPPPPLWVQRLKLPWRPQPINYRGQGLGSALLSYLIEHARTQGFASLWGEVFRPDVENTPKLLDWYQKHGFEIRPTTCADKPDLLALLYLGLE